MGTMIDCPLLRQFGIFESITDKAIRTASQYDVVSTHLLGSQKGVDERKVGLGCLMINAGIVPSDRDLIDWASDRMEPVASRRI